jgi:hypothetical protein
MNGLLPRFLALLLAALAFLTLVTASSTGVRGTDGYWYVSEARAVASGDARSNSLFPNPLQQDPEYLTERPFIHATALPYALAPLSLLVGPYVAWLVANVVFAFGAAALIYGAIRRVRPNGDAAFAATIGAAGFLLLPTVVWLAAQPGPEMALALLCAMACWIVASGARREVVFATLMLLALIAGSLRSIFEPAVLACVVVFIALAIRSKSGARWLEVGGYLVGGMLALAWLMRGGGTLGYSVLELAQNGASSGDNMEIWLADGSLSPKLTDIAGKFVRNVLEYFSPSLTQAFFAPFLLLTLLTFGSLVRRVRSLAGIRHEDAPLSGLIILLATLLGINFIVITVHQNQFRYTLMLLPALIVCAAGVSWPTLNRLKRHRSLVPVLAASAAGFLVVDTALVLRMREEGRTATEQTAALALAARSMPSLIRADTVIDCWRIGDSLALAHAWPEKLLIHFDAATGVDFFNRTVRTASPDILVCPSDQAELLLGDDAETLAVGVIPGGAVPLRVYDLSGGTAPR